jgi:hypothetical protein
MNWILSIVAITLVTGILVGAYRLRNRYEIVREFLQFLKESKHGWLIGPLVLIFILAGLFVAIMASSPVGIFLYVLH